MTQSPAALREAIAEALWQADSTRTTGRPRRTQWADEGDVETRDAYRVSADAVLALPDLAALLSQPPAVPEGWVMVPRKATTAMTVAGDNWCYAAEMWPAMLAAAPTPPASPAPDTVSFVQEWMMSGDYKADKWHRDFAAAIDARTAPDTSALVEARRQVINTPETADFMAGVPLEATHQRERWGSDHDAGKTPFDWFWLVGYLAQKAADAAVRGDSEKAKHHTISTAAALANWHCALAGIDTSMRPGIAPPDAAHPPQPAADEVAK